MNLKSAQKDRHSPVLWSVVGPEVGVLAPCCVIHRSEGQSSPLETHLSPHQYFTPDTLHTLSSDGQ